MHVKPKLSPLVALLIYAGFLIAMMTVIGPVVRALAEPHLALQDVRSKTAFRGGLAILFNWIDLAVAILLLRMRGQTFSDAGWGGAGRIWGWLLAGAVLAFLVWSAFFGPVHFLDKATWLSDRSFFRIAMALGIGITVGICEEGVFRGFLMTEMRDAGAPVYVQILASGLIFGLGHVGWGGFNSHFDFQAAFSAFWGTAIFGALFAVVFVLARRRLMPGMVAHGLFGAIFEPWMLMMGIAGTLHIGH